jgi:hypothetical protein
VCFLVADVLGGLFACFDLYFCWLNLLGGLVFGAIGATDHSSKQQSIFLVSFLALFLVGTLFLFFDAKIRRRGRLSDRVRVMALGCFTVILAAVSITDRFVRPVFYSYTVCFLSQYCTSTRQLASSCIQTAAVFAV